MTKKIKILIIEDELIIAESIAISLKKMGYFISGKAKTYKEAIDKIRFSDFDLALIDINLEGNDEGITIGGILNEIDKPFIYITAYSTEKTISKAAKTLPDSYIIKPFTEGDLLSSIEIAIARQNKKESLLKKPRITITNRQKKIYLDPDEILWIKSDDIYIEIQTLDKKIVKRDSLSSFIKSLPECRICRVHRSWAINLNHIDAQNANDVVINNTNIPVSKKFKKQLHELQNKSEFIQN